MDGYKDLSSREKQLVEMYITARQFNNAILEDEMIMIPAKAFNNKEGTINWGSIKVSVRGDKTIVRIYPYIVDKAFACEVYLKLLLSIEDDVNCRKYGHNIHKLYESTDDVLKNNFLNKFKTKFGETITEEFLLNEIKNISNVFEEWRYIYEKTGIEKTVNYGFLNAFCNYLDRYAHKKILEKFNYDVDKNLR